MQATERYIWKNTLTGHWILSSYPRPVDGRAGSATNRQGFRTWEAALAEANIQLVEVRASYARIAAEEQNWLS